MDEGVGTVDGAAKGLAVETLLGVGCGTNGEYGAAVAVMKALGSCCGGGRGAGTGPGSDMKSMSRSGSAVG